MNFARYVYFMFLGGRGEGGVSYLQILVCTNTRITKFVVVSNQTAT